MEGSVPSIHHVTAIAGPPQPNVDFYTEVLGLRLVKRTINFDDPGTYHLYYGDEVGRPGTALTFFPWPDGLRGRAGTGQAVVVSFSVPEDSLDYWTRRLNTYGYSSEVASGPFGEDVLRLPDPDGLELQLVADLHASELPAWDGSPVPTSHTIRGFHSTTLCVEGYEQTAQLLAHTFGFEQTKAGNNDFRFRSPAGDRSRIIDLQCQPHRPKGRMGVGTIHHVAFRASDDDEQLQWRTRLNELGFDVTPVIDRQYFKSIYFREPGGVLFEIATDGPGFTADESVQALGTNLKLPPLARTAAATD